MSPTDPEEVSPPRVKSMDEHIEDLQIENAELHKIIDRLKADDERLVQTLMQLSRYVVELHLLVDMQKKLREQVAGWRPIAEYDAVAEKPKGIIVFWAAELKNGRSILRPRIFTERYPGFRNVTHFYVLPEPQLTD